MMMETLKRVIGLFGVTLMGSSKQLVVKLAFPANRICLNF